VNRPSVTYTESRVDKFRKPYRYFSAVIRQPTTNL